MGCPHGNDRLSPFPVSLAAHSSVQAFSLRCKTSSTKCRSCCSRSVSPQKMLYHLTFVAGFLKTCSRKHGKDSSGAHNLLVNFFVSSFHPKDRRTKGISLACTLPIIGISVSFRLRFRFVRVVRAVLEDRPYRLLSLSLGLPGASTQVRPGVFSLSFCAHVYDFLCFVLFLFFVNANLFSNAKH